MKKSSTLAIATALLFATGGVALAEQADTGADARVDCTKVFKAKASADKTISSKQLAQDLNLPIETVNECLLRLRQVGPRPTPGSAQ